MAKQRQEKKSGNEVIATRALVVFAAVCPGNNNHRNTRVYKTKGKTRYCVCDECGETWKQIAEETNETAKPADDEDRQFLTELADSLESSPTTKVGDIEAIIIPLSEAKPIIERLKAITKS